MEFAPPFWTSYQAITTTKIEIDDGKPPSCKRFSPGREIDCRLFEFQTTTAFHRRCLSVKMTVFKENRRCLEVKIVNYRRKDDCF
ncbi:unnamed protein product [Prunus armeniaca]